MTNELIATDPVPTGPAALDDEHCYQALRGRDARFDGYFFVGVHSTGIYCRPSCPAVLPRREHVRFYASSAAAQAAGLRACKRCRPDASPDSPEWNVRADVVGRAMRLLADGAVDREGVSGLALRLGYSQRQLHRLLLAELGAGPLALARARRAQTARVLLETSELPVSEVAFAAGFTSIRQFNATLRQVFALTPTELRARARRGRRPAGPAPASAGVVSLRLGYRPPLDLPSLFAFLAARAVPGVESYADGVYRRVLRLPHGLGTVSLRAGESGGPHVRCELRLADWRDLSAAVARCRRLLDLDADPIAVTETLGADPVLAPLVAATPGRRVPGHVDPVELAVRAVLGQQVSVAGARTLAARLALRYGTPLAEPDGELTHAFPDAAALAAADPESLPMPASRRRALLGLVTAVADGEIPLDAGADRDEISARLLALPGIGPWTVAYVRMRALGDPDAFLPTDLGVRNALRRLGHPSSPADAERTAQAWRPWRAYGLSYLWSALDSVGAPAELAS